VEVVRRQVAVAMSQGGRLPRVVAYCNTGERSAAASVLLSQALGLAVRSLCGGIINYYNQGGRVRVSGAEVQAIHPGSAELKPFVTRPNSFKGL
jgi:predicted sulfurtransferase